MAVHEACDREIAAALRDYRSWTANCCRSGGNNNNNTTAKGSRCGSRKIAGEINNLPGASPTITGDMMLFAPSPVAIIFDSWE